MKINNVLVLLNLFNQIINYFSRGFDVHIENIKCKSWRASYSHPARRSFSWSGNSVGYLQKHHWNWGLVTPSSFLSFPYSIEIIMVFNHSSLVGLSMIFICSKIFPTRYFASNPCFDGDRHPAGTYSHLCGHCWHEVYEMPGRRWGAEDADGCHWGCDISYCR